MSKNKKQPDPMNVYVGDRIRTLRKSLNMTQQQLGDLIGITFQQIQKYEKGINQVSASRLKIFSEILDVPVSCFFADPNETHNSPDFNDGFAEGDTPPLETSDLAKEGTQLIEAFRQINDPKVRQKLIDLAKALAKNNSKQHK